MKRLFLLGCGYLGQRVLEISLQQGWDVWASTRKSDRFEELRRLGAQPVQMDVLDRASLSNLPESDAVVFGVGMDRSQKASMRTVYVEGLEAVLTTSTLARSATRWIYLSSTSVYGQTGGEEIEEGAPAQPQEESGRVVLDAEELLLRYRPDAIRLRLAGLYGPNRLLRAPSLKAGEPIPGSPDQWLNLIQVQDAAQAVLAALLRAQPGTIYNIVDDAPVRRIDFFKLLAQLLGAPAPTFVPDPGRSAPGSALPPHRRIRNQRMRQELGVELRFPSYREGLLSSGAGAAAGSGTVQA